MLLLSVLLEKKLLGGETSPLGLLLLRPVPSSHEEHIGMDGEGDDENWIGNVMACVKDLNSITSFCNLQFRDHFLGLGFRLFE